LTDYQAIVETSRSVDAKALAPLSLLPAGGFAGIIGRE
jgi:hypothetical protein